MQPRIAVCKACKRKQLLKREAAITVPAGQRRTRRSRPGTRLQASQHESLRQNDVLLLLLLLGLRYSLEMLMYADTDIMLCMWLESDHNSNNIPFTSAAAHCKFNGALHHPQQASAQVCI